MDKRKLKGQPSPRLKALKQRELLKQKNAELREVLVDLMDDVGAGSVPEHYCPNPKKCQTCEIWKRAFALTKESEKDT